MESHTAPTPIYASFNTRLIASSVDIMLIMLLAVPCIDWLTDTIFSPLNLDMVTSLGGLGETPDPHQTLLKLVEMFKDLIIHQHMIERLLLEYTLQILFIALYTLPFWFRYSSTPGKMLFRVEIQDVMTGAHMTRRQSVIRFLGYILSTLPLTFGFIWALFNKKCQTWHDVLANTVVVKRPKKKKSL